MDQDVVITLIGTRLAKVDNEFIFSGQIPECAGCKLVQTCMNLDRGTRYRIVGVREGAKHECAIHDAGVLAVEVIESPFVAAIESRKAFGGSKIVFEPAACDVTGCGMFELCHPSGLSRGDRCTIVRVVGDAPESCEKGYSLKVVEVKR